MQGWGQRGLLVIDLHVLILKGAHLVVGGLSVLTQAGELLLLLFHSDVELHDLVLRDLGVLMGQTGLAQQHSGEFGRMVALT